MPKKSTPFSKKRRQTRSDLVDLQPDHKRVRVPADLEIEAEAEILELIKGWTGSYVQAVACYDTEPLPSFDNLTVAELMRQGRADAVKAYIERIADGGYA